WNHKAWLTTGDLLLKIRNAFYSLTPSMAMARAGSRAPHAAARLQRAARWAARLLHMMRMHAAPTRTAVRRCITLLELRCISVTTTREATTIQAQTSRRLLRS